MWECEIRLEGLAGFLTNGPASKRSQSLFVLHVSLGNQAFEVIECEFNELSILGKELNSEWEDPSHKVIPRHIDDRAGQFESFGK